MKYIKQKSTGLAVYRERPHVNTTLTQAVRHTGIAIDDLEVVDEPLTGEQWNQKAEDAKPWLEKIADTDSGMPRYLEDLITSNASLVIPAEMKKRYDDKIKVRSERP